MEGEKSLWSPEGEEALDYLRNRRHLSDEVIKRFRFGYCPAQAPHDLAGRLLMPCFDAHDNLIAFSTRDWRAPKRWQHWHESFDKNSHLFGINVAKRSMRYNNKAIIVEGQFDVTCLHSYGFSMTVGLFGTTLSIMHVAILSRYCSDIYIVLDPDVVKDDGKVNRSGQEATEKALKLYNDYHLQGYGINFIPVVLPEELDPDEYVVKYGRSSFINLLEKSREALYG